MTRNNEVMHSNNNDGVNMVQTYVQAGNIIYIYLFIYNKSRQQRRLFGKI